MSEEKALIPIEEQAVDFYGDEITTAIVNIDDHTRMYVPIKPINDYLGLTWSGQFERIQRDPVLAGEVRFIRVTRTNLGGDPEVLCLPVEFIHGWLFGINASRVKSELKEKIIRYQRECYHVLWEAFNPQALTSSSIGPSTLEQIRATGLAIAQLAEQQMEMEGRLTKRLDKAAEVVGDIQRRLGTVEGKLSPTVLVTEDQAETISSTVKALAELMTEKAPGKNHYQGIFSELYRRYGVSSYKNIRLDHYEKVIQFLEDWRKAVQKGDSSQEP